MDRETARLRFKALQTEGGKVSPAELDEIWSALDTVRPEEILGKWRGSEFDNGHPLCGALPAMGWYGKTFNSVLDAKPMIMRGPDGELFSDVESLKGEASLWMIEFRGECTATMVYDGIPVFDHFILQEGRRKHLDVHHERQDPARCDRHLPGGRAAVHLRTRAGRVAPTSRRTRAEPWALGRAQGA